MSWSTKRQFIIVIVFILILVGLALAFFVPRTLKEPTCFDGKKNGEEFDIDCGGSCQKLCKSQTADVSVKWARSFAVTGSVWSAVAYIENPNVTAAAREVPYEFRLYDEKNTFIAVREGKAYIAPNGTSAIFEGGIQVGSRVPKYTTFKFLADPVWLSVDPRVGDIKIFPSNQKLENLETRPRFSAIVRNDSQFYNVNDIDIIVLLYDKDGNAIGVSKTYVDGLTPGGDESIFFTWQKPFSAEVVRNEIIPRFNVFTARFD
jgi:hypothetical protein